MSEQDKDIEWLKASVSCAVLLERLPPVWRLDRGESSRASLKYRRAPNEILIVNHDGRGWWDPLSDAKGDIFVSIRRVARRSLLRRRAQLFSERASSTAATRAGAERNGPRFERVRRPARRGDRPR